ncbi:MAG TPA: nuclear transport factor 2 family protein [Steroidobacteraceae bacterium]
MILLAACSTTRPHAADTSAQLAAISAFNARYLKAINEGDIATLSSVTNDDHVMISPNRPPVTGKADNDAANGRTFQRSKIDETWMPIETVIDGDLAYQRGTFMVVASPRTGGVSRTTHGNFLRIYRRQSDGSWWMTRDMFSSDQPLPAN